MGTGDNTKGTPRRPTGFLRGVAYMTRTGKVDVERFVTAAPAVARRGLAAYAGLSDTAVPARDVAEWILAQPLTHDGRTHPRRIADGDLRDALTTAIVEGSRHDMCDLAAGLASARTHLVAMTQEVPA